jgi:serine/threonine-protein kinase
MAHVYLALVAGPVGVNKLMVLKVAQPEMLHGLEGGIELFWDEARLAARLVHPNIVHTYEVGQTDGEYFLAMEYLDGQTYRGLRARLGSTRLPLHEELRILSEVARGLHYAHELKGFQGETLGVVHRDVSPQNVFITYDGQVKLIDFGIAKTHDSTHETRVGVIKGKLTYMAPEQLRGDPLDGRADVFSLGAMLWEALSGRSFAGGAKVPEVAKLHARILGDEPKIRTVQPDVAEELAQIVDRALAVDREQRFSDAGAFADALEAYIEKAGERPSGKSLSSWMNKAFAEDRVAMHKLIDQHVQALTSRPSQAADELPRISLGDDVHTSSGVWMGPEGKVGNAVGHSHLARKSAADGTSSARAFRRAVGVAGLGLGAVVLLVMLSSSKDAPSAQPVSAPAVQPALASTSASGSVAPAALPPQQAASNAIVHIETVPADAQLHVDGVVVAAPFRGEFARSAALHRIEASAPGYQSVARLVAFDGDQTVQLSLERAALARGSAREQNQESASRRSAHPRSIAASHDLATASAPSPEPRPSSGEAPAAAPAAIAPGADLEANRGKGLQNAIDTADPYATRRNKGARLDH